MSVRACMVFGLLTLVSAAPAAAQDFPPLELAGGVSLMQFVDTTTGRSTGPTLKGGLFALDWNLTEGFGLVGEVSSESASGAFASQIGVLGGLRFRSAGETVKVYFQILGGGNIQASQSYPAGEAGLGLDFTVLPYLAVRVEGGARAVVTNVNTGSNSVFGRGMFGVVYRFGVE